MRILLGIDTHGLVGGSERYALQVADELRARGHQVGLLCGSVATGASAPDDLFALPAYSAERATPQALDELERTIRAFRPDVLYLLSARGRAAVRRMTRLAREVPVVRFVQDHALFCPGLTKMHADGANCHEPMGSVCLRHYFLKKGCTAFRLELHRSPLDAFGGLWKWKRGLDQARRASSLVVASRYMRDELLAVGLPPEKIELIPLFTRSAEQRDEPRQPAEESARFAQSKSAPLILIPARLSAEKGIDLLLEALSRVSTPFRALIAGSGPLQALLEQRTRELELHAKVHFAGWQDSAALEWLYEAADFVVFPSTWNEPFGLVGLEAMAHGKAVVAFDVGGVRDWLTHESTGLVCPPREVDALARSIELLLLQPELRHEYGRKGRETVRQSFSAEAHVHALEALFARLSVTPRTSLDS